MLVCTFSYLLVSRYLPLVKEGIKEYLLKDNNKHETDKQVTDSDNEISEQEVKISEQEVKTTYLHLSKEEAIFPKIGGSVEILVECDGASWNVGSKSSWINVTKTNNKMILSCDNNISGQDRYENVMVVSGEKQCNIYVSQTSIPTTMDLSKTKLNVRQNGGTYYINVNTDADSWTATCNNKNVTLTPNGNTLKIYIPQADNSNFYWISPTGASHFTGQIMYGIEINAKNLTRYISITQYGPCMGCKGTGSVRQIMSGEYLQCNQCKGTGKNNQITYD